MCSRLHSSRFSFNIPINPLHFYYFITFLFTDSFPLAHKHVSFTLKTKLLTPSCSLLCLSLLSFHLWHFLLHLPLFPLNFDYPVFSPEIFNGTTQHPELHHFPKIFTCKTINFEFPLYFFHFILLSKFLFQLRLRFLFPIVSETSLSREYIQVSKSKQINWADLPSNLHLLSLTSAIV